MSIASIAPTPAPGDDPRYRGVTVRHLGTIGVRARLPRDQARALAKKGMDPAIRARAFRDSVLESAVDGVDIKRLNNAARHRVALAVLRTWGASLAWCRLYGSELSIEVRMRRVLVQAVREQARPRTIRHLQDDLQHTTASIVALPAQRILHELGRRLEEPSSAIQRALDGVTARLREPMERLQRWFHDLLAPLGKRVEALVRAPALRSAAEIMNRRVDLGRADGPLANLLRVYRERGNALDRLPHRSPAAPDAKQDPVSEIVLPDDGTLVAFFGEERGDAAWRRGPLGWLLRAVPLPLGAAIHDRLQESSEAALAWMAERLLRRELRRVLEPALTSVQCEQATRDVLLAGVDHYLRREWAPADTLLTAGLDGLLLDLAFQRGVVTEARRLRREDGRPGAQMNTAGNTKLLTQMGFDGSQIAYLTGLSLGPTGNPPRHGSMSPIGSDVHAAGSLLGLLLVLGWAGQERPLVARALAAA